MNRRKYHKFQTSFEKRMKLKERLIDKVVSVNHLSREDAKEFVEWRLHLKGVSISSYCQFKKVNPKHPINALKRAIEKLSEEEQ